MSNVSSLPKLIWQKNKYINPKIICLDLFWVYNFEFFLLFLCNNFGVFLVYLGFLLRFNRHHSVNTLCYILFKSIYQHLLVPIDECIGLIMVTQTSFKVGKDWINIISLCQCSFHYLLFIKINIYCRLLMIYCGWNCLATQSLDLLLYFDQLKNLCAHARINGLLCWE